MTTSSFDFITGKVAFTVREEIFYTHYRICGDLKASGRRPLIALHGGPGFPSNYMEPFALLNTLYGIPVILYDQLGCGASLPEGEDRTRLDNMSKDGKDFWTFDLFLDELENILDHLGIGNDFDLLGHSWGGILANQFAAHRQPKGLKSLILADSLASANDWLEATWSILDSEQFKFPRQARNVMKFAERHPGWETSMTVEEIKQLESDGVGLKSPQYRAALQTFMKHFVLRIDPWPESWKTAVAGSGKSPLPPIMWGPWCNPTGALKYYDAKKDLHKINVPQTLVYNGAYEQAQDSVVEPFFRLINKVKWVRFENSSHCPHYEEPDRCMSIIAEFLLSELA